MYSFSYLEPVCCSLSSSNPLLPDLHTGFSRDRSDGLTWYSHLFKNFPQFIVIHTVKVFDIVNKAEIEVLLELSCFFDDPVDHQKSTRIPKNICFCFIDYAKAFDCMDHNKLWKILKEMGIPDHLTFEKPACRSGGNS